MSALLLTPKPPSFRESLRELWAYRELLWIFVQRDLRVRYKNSALGFFWSLVNPLLQVLTLTVVLLFLLEPNERPQNYHAYVFCAMLPWLFFSTTLMDSCNALLAYYSLLQKTYFPREILPLAVVAANLIHFVMSTAALLVYLLLNALFWWVKDGSFDLALLPTALLVPIPMLGMTLLAAGCGLFLCVWTLYFEDVRFLVDSGLKMLYWAVPILYFGDAVLRKLGEPAYILYMLNPLAGWITAFRKLMMPPTRIIGVEEAQAVTSMMGTGEWLFLGAALVSSSLLLLLGMHYFNSRKWKLAERG